MNAAEFEHFYLGTRHRLLRYAYGLTGDLAEAQDFAQEAYARAWSRWRRTVLGHAEWAVCSWNATMPACPTKQGISLWRYRSSE